MRNSLDRRDLQSIRGARMLVLACALSAGAHAGLVPAHLDGEPRLGEAFLVAVALLLACGTAVTARPGDRRVTAAAGLVLGGLVAAYLASRTTGIPLLDPEPEALDAVGLFTTGVEAVGVVVALWLIQSGDLAGRHPTTGGL